MSVTARSRHRASYLSVHEFVRLLVGAEYGPISPPRWLYALAATWYTQANIVTMFWSWRGWHSAGTARGEPMKPAVEEFTR